MVFAILSVSLIARGRGDARRVISLAVFAFSCVLLLSLSGVYHLLSPGTRGRGVLMRLDHAAIFVLIAGSFTPVHVILLRDRWHWHLLAWIWVAGDRRAGAQDGVLRRHAGMARAADVPGPGLAGD